LELLLLGIYAAPGEYGEHHPNRQQASHYSIGQTVNLEQEFELQLLLPA
jgi:hypothetical protein